MKPITSLLPIITLTAGLALHNGATAAEMPELARKLGCTQCHALDKRMVGPAWQDVSRKYSALKDDAQLKLRLVAKISGGGGGNWGRIPMPPQDPTGQKQAEIRELVDFILTLAN